MAFDVRSAVVRAKIGLASMRASFWYRRRPMDRLRRSAFLWVVLAAAAASVLMVRDSPHGVGVGFDSTHYLSAATNLRDGNGLNVSFSSGFEPLSTKAALASYGSVPLTHFPPGYPVALAATDVLLPGGLRTAVRAMGVLAVFLTVVVASAFARALGATTTVAAAAGFVVGVTPSLQRTSMWALSDALAAGFALAAMAVAARGGRARLPGGRALSPTAVECAAGVVAALATLLRYGGVGAAVGVALLAFDRRATPARHVATLARTVGPSVVVLGAMFAANAWRGPNAARPVVWHPPSGVDARLFVSTAGLWLLGDGSDARLRGGALIVLACVGAATWWAWNQPGRVFAADIDSSSKNDDLGTRRIAVALVAFAITQIAVLLVTTTWLDADVSFDRRLMLPAELALEILVLGVIAAAPRPALAIGACAVLVALRAQVTTGPYPQGLSVPDGAPPEAVFVQLDSYAADVVIATSVPEFVWASTGRASIVAPAAYDKLTAQANPHFASDLVELGRLVGERHGILLVQRVESPRLTRPSDVARLLPCATTLYDDDRNLIYDLTPCAG